MLCKVYFLLIVMPQMFQCFIGRNWIIVEKYSILIVEIGLMIFKGVQCYAEDLLGLTVILMAFVHSSPLYYS